MPTAIIIESEPWRFTDANKQWQTLRPLALTQRLLFRERWQELSEILNNLKEPEWAGEFRIKAEKLLSMVGVESGLDFAIATQLLFSIFTDEGVSPGLILLQNCIDPSAVWPVQRPNGATMAQVYDYDDVFRHCIDSTLKTWGLNPNEIDIETAQRLLLSEGDGLGALFQLEFYDTGLKGESLDDDDHPAANAFASLLSEHWGPVEAAEAIGSIPWNPLQGGLSIRAEAMKKAMDEAKGKGGSSGNPVAKGNDSAARQELRERYLDDQGNLKTEEHPEMAQGLAFMRKFRGAKRKG